MSDFITVMCTILALGLIAWFVSRNDAPGNDRPEKTLLAMREDPELKRRR